MDFKAATTTLFAHVTADDLAASMGVGLQTIRQARSDENSTAFRRPPNGWEAAVKTLAEKQIRHYQKLVDKLGR